jgi:hypothetical protein
LTYFDDDPTPAVRWRCADCDRTYDRPLETCRCGSAAVHPDDGERTGRYSLLAIRRRLIDPGSADRSLVGDDRRITVVFRAVLVVSLLTVAAAALLVLL